MNRPSSTTTSLADIRTQRHAQWLRELRLLLQELVEPSLERPDQIYLFGSRARGDWDGLSDTDLLVAANQHLADTWVYQVLDSCLAEDVMDSTVRPGISCQKAHQWFGATLPRSLSVTRREAMNARPDAMDTPSPKRP
ncbi:nucleotidyltransferase domain-containing protein [bacterium]|nr:nucleotidyltransferase domain-containing protein [bacterium]MDB4379561.1 nucleotidyltransferase domain-containing protein [bacterium]